jgi:hypothetical protein
MAHPKLTWVVANTRDMQINHRRAFVWSMSLGLLGVLLFGSLSCSALVGVVFSLLLLLYCAANLSLRMLSFDRGLATLTLFAGMSAFAVTSAGYLELIFQRPFFTSSYVISAISALCIVSSWVARSYPIKPKQTSTSEKRGLFFWLCILMLVFVFVLAFIVALSAPPRGYDALWFHLPLADHFQRTASLLPPSSFKWFWHPANINICFAALLTLTHGSALNTTSIAFLGLLTYLTPRIYQRLCLDEEHTQRGSLILALWISTTPCYFFLSMLVLTDLPSIGLTALSLYWFIVWYQSRERAHLFLAGIAVGLSLGTKTAALPIFGGFIVLLVFEFLLGKYSWKTRLTLLFIFLLGAFAAGGFWYVRNGVLLSNPFHPLSIAVGPFQLGADDLGIIDPKKESHFLGGSDWWRWLYFPFSSAWYSHEWGMGILPGMFVLVGFLSLPVLLLHQNVSPLVRALLFLIALHLVGWWTVSRHFRHLLLLWPVALPLMMRVFLKIRFAWVLAFLWSFVAVGTIVYISLFTNRWEQSIEEEPDWHAYYGLPANYESQLPKGAVIANLIGEPNNFSLSGMDGRFRVIGYNDAKEKTAAQLQQMGAKYAISLHRAKDKPTTKEGLELIAEWPLPKRFRWWGFFKREYAVMRLWRVMDS